MRSCVLFLAWSSTSREQRGQAALARGRDEWNERLQRPPKEESCGLSLECVSECVSECACVCGGDACLFVSMWLLKVYVHEKTCSYVLPQRFPMNRSSYHDAMMSVRHPRGERSRYNHHPHNPPPPPPHKVLQSRRTSVSASHTQLTCCPLSDTVTGHMDDKSHNTIYIYLVFVFQQLFLSLWRSLFLRMMDLFSLPVACGGVESAALTGGIWSRDGSYCPSLNFLLQCRFHSSACSACQVWRWRENPPLDCCFSSPSLHADHRRVLIGRLGNADVDRSQFWPGKDSPIGSVIEGQQSM